jgi:hypothetical protein
MGKRRQMGDGKFPLPSGAMLRALRKELGREPPVDLEELELYRIAAAVGRRIHESKGARKLAAVIA